MYRCVCGGGGGGKIMPLLCAYTCKCVREDVTIVCFAFLVYGVSLSFLLPLCLHRNLDF